VTTIETIQSYTPIGVELWDLLTDTRVTDGLAVSARPTGRSGRFWPAYRTPSGIHAVTGVPALREIEHPRPTPGRRVDLEDLPSDAGIDVDILVEDRQGRFLTSVFRVQAPRPGVSTTADALAGCAALAVSLPDDLPMFVISAPGRSFPASMAVVRACLRRRDQENDAEVPAAHAVVTVVDPAGERHAGVADVDGNVVVAFPYPAFASPLGSDPVSAGAHGVPTMEQRWPLTVEVRCQPDLLTYPDGVGVPHAHTLFCQRPGRIRRVDGDPTVPSIDVELEYGRELVLATRDVPDPERAGFLHLEGGP
jgi:hypothetical protein